MSPVLHISSSSLTQLTLCFFCFFFFLTFVLFHYLSTPPCLYHSFCLSVSLSFVFFPSLRLHRFPSPSIPPPFLLLWMDRDFLFTTGNAVPALLTNQQEGISARDEPGMLVFLTASHVSLSGVCVRVCMCLTHGLLSSQTEGLLWHVTQLCHTWGQNRLIRSTLTKCGFQIWTQLFYFNWWWKYSGLHNSWHEPLLFISW